EDAERVGGTDRKIPSDIPVEDGITESKRKGDIAKKLGAAAAVLALKPSEVALRKRDAAAQNRFEWGISKVSRARAIVTDRLH
ncbi:exopolysaccharide biosynthesis protein, partial [Rhizobium leguminosarum]